ncbi:uncharacterized protein MONOS_17437 [Monocercomonoides exilis]|uniref:uncharacterized protein n=1 Tax=Monocercomonoides exilis TaxID=2049356 RepID=UPI00355A93F8|nr:hypothetical protein MONOS_17437 [Monocercomonoides exilis]
MKNNSNKMQKKRAEYPKDLIEPLVHFVGSTVHLAYFFAQDLFCEIFYWEFGFVEKERELGVGQWRKRVELSTQQASITISFAFCTNSTGFSAFDDVLCQPFIIRKPAGLIITNPLEMGKYFKAEKMIDHEQECNRKKPSFHFAKDPKILRLFLYFELESKIGVLPKREEKKEGRYGDGQENKGKMVVNKKSGHEEEDDDEEKRKEKEEISYFFKKKNWIFSMNDIKEEKMFHIMRKESTEKEVSYFLLEKEREKEESRRKETK